MPANSYDLNELIINLSQLLATGIKVYKQDYKHFKSLIDLYKVKSVTSAWCADPNWSIDENNQAGGLIVQRLPESKYLCALTKLTEHVIIQSMCIQPSQDATVRG